MRAFAKDLHIATNLFEIDENNSEWAGNLTIAYSCAGGLYEEQGNLNRALDFYRKSVILSRKFMEVDMSGITWKGTLATNQQNVDRILKYPK